MTRFYLFGFVGILLALLLLGSFELGAYQGGKLCRANAAAATAATQAAQAAATTTAVVQAASAAQATTAAAVASAARVGQRREAHRAQVDAFFTPLQEPAYAAPPISDPLSAATECSLDADSLRRWAQANAGPWGSDAGHPASASAATGQPAGGAAHAAPAALGLHVRPVGQPLASGSPAPPPALSGVPAAGTPGRAH